MMRAWRPPVLRYGLAILASAAALALSLAYWPIVEPNRFTLFLGAIAVTAWYGGMRPALVAIGASLLALDYFLEEPFYSLGPKALATAVRLIGFTLVGGTIDRQLGASRAGREAAADNARLAELRYRGGVASYLESLTAQQALYNAERSLVNVQRLRAINLVALYRSLGGEAFE